MNQPIKHRIWGLVTTGILLISGIVFLWILAGSALLPTHWFIIGAVVLLALTAGVLALVWDSRKRVRTILGSVLAVILVLVQIAGDYYIHTGVTALKHITTPKTETVAIGVYVKQDDPARQLSDAKDYIFGILKEQDRDMTDGALDQLAEQFEKEPAMREYTDITALLDALLDTGETQAILLNTVFLDLFDEVEGYDTYLSQLRQLHLLYVETADEQDAISLPEASQDDWTGDDTFTMYISGIDCYGSISSRSRSDVNILATVNVKTGQVLLVSTPRDYYVPLSISNGVPDKLTHAGIYGIQVSKDTLGMLYGIDIDYYFRVNFDGFTDIIDALGGITVDSEYAFSNAGYTFQQGENNLDAEAALVFARTRYAFASGDRQRGKNQMAVIKGVIQKMVSPALLKNYKAILDGMTGSFETNMPYETIAQLVQNQLTTGTSWNVVTYSVDGTGDSQIPYSMSAYAYVMIPDQTTVDHAKELMAQVKNGEVPVP